ncbi:MAG: hypothetical protein HQL46_02975 [Gammaproteobacteria bacterium]|nr:hypothetical protein [Gammaproteobacteria bacterium]
MKVFNRANIKSILVDASIDQNDVYESFKLATEKPGNYEIELTNNITLGRDRILFLASLLKQATYKLSIRHPFLSGYLAKLGIHHKRAYSAFESTKPEIRHFDVVLLAGSAGSLENIIKILELMPNTHISFVIVQHISNHSKKYLDNIILNKTGHQAQYIDNGTVIMPGQIYIAPPGFHSVIESGIGKLLESEPVNYARPAIDVTLESLVNTYQHNLAIVLLCGYNVDGTTRLE